MPKKLDRYEFIWKAIQKHGYKYDYRKVKYIDSQTKVCIVCPNHGEFYISPNHHLKGKSCAKCKKVYQYTTEEFIEKAKEVHGDKYNYSKVNYINNRTKICIICHIHGEFYQTPHDHLSNRGCPKCGNICKVISQTFSNDDFINKAKLIHNDEYNYSKINYINAHENVCIICEKHGEFYQKAYSHLQGEGCPYCGIVKIGDSKRSDVFEFIKKAKLIHNDKYNYSKVKYINSQTKVCINCHIHGEFYQKPNNHLNGQGCPECAKENNNIDSRKTLTQFLEQAKIVQGDKYDYSKVKYVNNHTKICIICPEHGEFWQTSDNHLNRKNGCPYCRESKLEKEISIFLDKNKISYERQYKPSFLKNGCAQQSLDFYLSDYKIGIECQGKQHFAPFSFGSKKENAAENYFKEIIERDEKKLKLCTENDIKLLYFTHYKEKTDNVIYNAENIFFTLNDIMKKIKENY